MKLLLLLLIPALAQAFEVSEVSIDYGRFYGTTRIAELGDHVGKESLALNMRVSVWGPFYINSRVHSLTDSGQYRLIGLEEEFGARFFKNKLEPYARHHSQHLLDDGAVEGRWPLENQIGVRVYLVGGRS